MTTKCEKCPSTATHYPRVYFQFGQERMGVLVNHPRCPEHQPPMAESYLRAYELDMYSAAFESEYGTRPDPRRTRVAFVLATDPQVVRWLTFLEQETRARVSTQERGPIVVEVVPDEEIPGLLQDYERAKSSED